MPHITVDYAPNLEPDVDIAALCDLLRCAAIETGVFPISGVRVRAFAATYVSIANGADQHGYIDISLRLRGGRDLELRQKATAHIFGLAEAFLAPVMARRSLALSFEMRDIDPQLSPKTGSIATFLPTDLKG
ncbi:MAG: 5-carboxymethyl-2-hydroxymuconate isomerase [Lutimaribacter sp.]